MAPGAIEARGLERTFKGGVEAVRGIDLSVAEGEVFGFLGPNGAGKTTTVRMLCTLLPPSAGTPRVTGVDVLTQGAEVRRRIGVALQEIGLDPVQTGRELLELQCGLYGITGADARRRAEELLELLGLTDAADRRTKTYSGGMKRRLDLASALVHSPDVLFLDEPTTGLDPASRLTVWDEVRRINATGTTIFLTTQYMEEADQLGRRAVREVFRMPEATIPTLFIPLFFLAVNIGQVSKTFPSSTPFLHGQGYVGFQIPVSLLFAVSTATSGLALVTEIDNGYFDKLLVAPIRRSSIIWGRLAADLVRGAMLSVLVLLLGPAFGAHGQAAVPRPVVLAAWAALWVLPSPG